MKIKKEKEIDKVKRKVKEVLSEKNIEMSFAQATEVVKIGEFYISSQYVMIGDLIKLAEKLIKNKDVQKLLETTENKKVTGRYYG